MHGREAAFAQRSSRLKPAIRNSRNHDHRPLFVLVELRCSLRNHIQRNIDRIANMTGFEFRRLGNVDKNTRLSIYEKYALRRCETRDAMDALHDIWCDQKHQHDNQREKQVPVMNDELNQG